MSHPNPITESNICNHDSCTEVIYDKEEYCDTHYEYYYCECGKPLEDSYGSPGDGFCVMCR